MNKMELRPRSFIIYAIGALCIAFAVIFMLRSNIGTSTWDSLHYAISNATGITFGTATIVVAVTFTIMVVIMQRSWHYAAMLIPIFFVGLLINFIDQVIMAEFIVTTLPARILSYAFGLALLPFGGALLIISTLPAGVFDEFNLALMKVLKSNKLVLIRGIMEVTAVLVAFCIGLYAGDAIGQIGIGTIIFSLTVGTFLKTYLSIFERIGLYEIKQND